MRAWLVGIIVEALTLFYERAVRPDVQICRHGYIGTTCGICRGGEK